MRDKVLLVSSQNDPHCDAVCHWLRRENLGESIIFDLHDFPMRVAMTFENGFPATLCLPGVGVLRADDIAGVWWRRPQSFSFQGAALDPSMEKFCEVNCRHAIQGFFEALSDRVVDPLFRVEAASRKLLQLHLAQNCGLTIPPTCVTNDPDNARKFVESQSGEVVYKIFRGDGRYYVGTMLWESSDLGNLHLVRYAPVIFQRYVEPGFDVRVTVVGSELFAAKLVSQKPDAQVDIRRDVASHIETHELPAHVERGLRALMSRLGLRFGAADFRVDRWGVYHFLEVNPTGQYLFVETATNQPITAALARLLANPSAR